MKAYLNTKQENNILYYKIFEALCKDRPNIYIFHFSDSADIYEFATNEQITKLTKMYLDQNSNITRDQVQEVAPDLAKLIDILNKDPYTQIENIYVTIDKYPLEGESISRFYFEEWAGLTPEQIIKKIYNSWYYEMKNNTVFLR